MYVRIAILVFKRQSRIVKCKISPGCTEMPDIHRDVCRVQKPFNIANAKLYQKST